MIFDLLFVMERIAFAISKMVDSWGFPKFTGPVKPLVFDIRTIPSTKSDI
jgi:hypothetical protein